MFHHCSPPLFNARSRRRIHANSAKLKHNGKGMEEKEVHAAVRRPPGPLTHEIGMFLAYAMSDKANNGRLRANTYPEHAKLYMPPLDGVDRGVSRNRHAPLCSIASMHLKACRVVEPYFDRDCAEPSKFNYPRCRTTRNRRRMFLCSWLCSLKQLRDMKQVFVRR